ncbi:MAG: hypothetical protein ACFUZC_08540 [Chthoniobacteraceae bacterium]
MLRSFAIWKTTRAGFRTRSVTLVTTVLDRVVQKLSAIGSLLELEDRTLEVSITSFRFQAALQ